MNFKETVVRGAISSEHLVQLFDDDGSLADAVFAFVHEGLLEGHAILLVLTPGHWEAIAHRAEALGADVPSLLASSQLTVRDAAATLGAFMQRGRPQPDRFEGTVGQLVHELTALGRHLRIYGEMVDLLVYDHDVRSAQELEGLWNDLGTRASFTLLCGYSAENFGARESAAGLRDICDLHTHVRIDRRDVLGSFLVDTTRRAS